MSGNGSQTVEMIAIDRITVINPRVRNRKVFEEMLDSIAELGLKRPITVATRESEDGLRFDLVCGQGRLEAFRELGQTDIPAIVITASDEDCLVMSLVENLARRQHRALDLLRDIKGLKERGYGVAEIARKTNLSTKYTRGVIQLLDNGEHRLLRGVESGKIPVSVAVDIAEAKDSSVREVLRRAYENNTLRGSKLLAAKRLVEARLRLGKGQVGTNQRKRRSLSVESLLRTYRDDVERKQILIRKATVTRSELMFVAQAVRTLLKDENFATLLRAEGLTTIPKNLASRLAASQGEIG